MGLLSWCILGFVAGLLARFILPGRDPGGFLVTTLVGIAGGVGGGFAATLLGLGEVKGFDLRSLGIAVVGSLVVLLLYRKIR